MLKPKNTVVLFKDPNNPAADHHGCNLLLITHHCEAIELQGRLQQVMQQFVTQHPENRTLRISSLLPLIPPEYFAQQTLTRQPTVLDGWVALQDGYFNDLLETNAPTTILLTPVESSTIEAIGHSGNTLRVQFKGGKLYDYSDFPSDHYNAFLASESKGKYFKDFIRGKYPSIVVTATPT